jgi:hypothetical protein
LIRVDFSRDEVMDPITTAILVAIAASAVPSPLVDGACIQKKRNYIMSHVHLRAGASVATCGKQSTKVNEKTLWVL